MKRLRTIVGEVGLRAAIARAAHRVRNELQASSARRAARRELQTLGRLSADSRFSFRRSASPRVSVIFISNGSTELALPSLAALSRTIERERCEVIVVTDAASPLHRTLTERSIDVHLLHHIDEAVANAAGEFVLWLSDNVRLTRDSLRMLVETLAARPDAVAAVPQLTDGKHDIVAAGGVVADGVPLLRGRGARVDDPRFQHVERVPWAPLDGMLVRAHLSRSNTVEELAASAAREGATILYQPRAIGIADDVRFSLPAAYTPQLREVPVYPVAMVIDEHVPFQDRDAGSRRLSQILEVLSKKMRVAFLSLDARPYEPYSERLRQQSVAVFLDADGDGFERIPFDTDPEIVWIARADVAQRTIMRVRARFPRAKIIFDTVDLHFARLEAEERVVGERRNWEAYREIEARLARAADAVVVTTDSDARRLQPFGIESRVVGMYEPVSAYGFTSFESRRGVLFLGNYAHAPNVDAASYLVRTVMPHVWQTDPEITVTLAGSDPTREILRLKSGRVRIPGYVHDLDQVFASHRVFVAPLRFGAGVKGKLVRAAAAGMPIVATPAAIEGTLENGEAIVAATPEAFAQAILGVYKNAELWHAQAANSLRAMARYTAGNLENQVWSAARR